MSVMSSMSFPLVPASHVMSNEVSVVCDGLAKAVKKGFMAKLHYFQSLIYDKEVVNINCLRLACSEGIPEGKGIRGIAWKLLLQLIPCDRSKWKETLRRKREQYQAFCRDFIVDPKAEENGYDLNPLDVRSTGHHEEDSRKMEHVQSGICDLTGKDHPLALDATSKWNVFFKDSEIREQIERDVMRTHPDMHFFNEDSPTSEVHREEIKRALFLFAKVNPGLTYVQGMNEIYAPLYYVFKTSESGEFGEQGGCGSTEHAEADAFFCFVDLMSEFRDNFCKQLDNSTSGVRGTIDKFSDLFLAVDPILWRHLKNKTQVDHHYFAFRWITLLLTQEFSFPDVLRLWDTLFSEPPLSRQNLLLRVCVAMLMHVREQLLRGDYTHNVKLLQRFPEVDVTELIRIARQISHGTTQSTTV